MKVAVIDVVLWLLASPVLLVRGLIRLVRRVRFYRMAYAAQVGCRHCGAAISLVNIWRCHCGYTSPSHLLRECPICGSLPRMVRCYSCGTTERLPEP
jgi:hypothetical protein